MKSEKQIQAARANGAHSKGPTSPRGKETSSRNSTRHGLLAETIVLEQELKDEFIQMHQDLTEEHQPRTTTELMLVETMTAARWRLQRIWALQKTALDRDMALMDPALGPAPVLAFLAMRGSPESSCSHELLLRYEIAMDRQFNRALSSLRKLRAQKIETGGEEPAPQHSSAKRTQEVVENTPRTHGKIVQGSSKKGFIPPPKYGQMTSRGKK